MRGFIDNLVVTTWLCDVRYRLALDVEFTYYGTYAKEWVARDVPVSLLLEAYKDQV